MGLKTECALLIGFDNVLLTCSIASDVLNFDIRVRKGLVCFVLATFEFNFTPQSKLLNHLNKKLVKLARRYMKTVLLSGCRKPRWWS